MGAIGLRIKNFLGLSEEQDEDMVRKKTVKFGDPSAVGRGRMWSVLSIIVLLSAWIILCELEIVPPLFWPSPLAVLKRPPVMLARYPVALLSAPPVTMATLPRA